MKLTLSFEPYPFCHLTKKSRQKLKYLENEKSFWGEIKSIFNHFLINGFQLPKIRHTESVSLRYYTNPSTRYIKRSSKNPILTYWQKLLIFISPWPLNQLLNVRSFECAKLRALRALVPCVSSRLTCSCTLLALAPYVPCVSYVPLRLACIKVYLVGCFWNSRVNRIKSCFG